MEKRLTKTKIKRNQIEAYLIMNKKDGMIKSDNVFFVAEEFKLTTQYVYQILKTLNLYETKNTDQK